VRGRDAGGAGRLARGEPAEERPERRVEATEGGLLGGERPPGRLPIGCPDLFQLGGLGGVANRHLRPVSRKVAWSASHHPLVGIPTLLEGCVVQLPVVVQARLQPQVLAGSGAKAELLRPSHAAASHWCSMYRRTVASQTYPTEAATYDFDHRTRHRPSHANSARSTRDV